MVGSIGPVLPKAPGQWKTQVRIPRYRRLSRVALSGAIVLDGVSDSFMLYFREVSWWERATDQGPVEGV